MTPRDRARWMEAVLAETDLAASAKLVAMRLALHLNLETDRCDPSVERLAAGCGLRPRATFAALATLEAGGWIKRSSYRGWHANSYSLTFPDVSTTGRPEASNPAQPRTVQGAVNSAQPRRVGGGEEASSPARSCTVGGVENPARMCTQTLHENVSKPCTTAHTNKEVNNQENRKPTKVAGKPAEIAAGKPAESETSSELFVQPRRRRGRRRIQICPPTHWTEFWDIYPRRTGAKLENVKRAFMAAVRGGTKPLQILNAAALFAEQCVGKDPRYIVTAVRWLHEERYLDDEDARCAHHEPAPARRASW